LYYNRLLGRRLDPPPAVIFCCQVCSTKAYAAAARKTRAEARGICRCVVCDQAFKPSRSDAEYCSGACRQKYYRRTRVTANARRRRRPPNSRNATAGAAS
jgi:hypothetical protein